MNTFLARDAKHRRDVFVEAGRRMGLQAASIEKDFWICWTLRVLFALPEIGPHLTFKGGTSLSKCWKLIERFSEDIDLVIEREFLGFGGQQSPEAADSSNKRKKQLESLMAVAQEYVRESLLINFENQVRQSLSDTETWCVEMDAEAEDQLCILFHYPSVFAAGGYMKPVVRIELGARSDVEPHAEPTITPYVAECVPEEFADASFVVRAVAPERTCLEKIALLHEENLGNKGPRHRLARHFYDLFRAIEAGVADKAISIPDLFDRVVEHRKVFFRKGGDAQTTLARGTLRLVPADDRLAGWKKDYDAMREVMFFGDPPSFKEILAVVAEFERRFNEIGS
jgi:predicted nucleotidyltransferase component of viral defense system